MSTNFSRPIFWPLVLVAAGGLWLLANAQIITASDLWILVQFWPLLLIAAGLDLLARQRWPWVGNLLAVATVTLAVLAVVFASRLGFSAASANWFNLVPFSLAGARGSGQVVTETRSVSDFQAVSLSAVGDLTITPGDSESLTIEAEDNVVPEFRTEVRDGTLYISLIETNGVMRVWPTQPVRLNLTVKKLNRVELSGAGNIRVGALTTDDLQAILSGAGSLNFDQLTAGQLRSSLSGAGSLTASGQAAHMTVDLSGVGAFQGQDLQAGSASVDISGTGGATVWVTNDLQANISGLGSLGYYGHPNLSKNISGLGSLRSLGDK